MAMSELLWREIVGVIWSHNDNIEAVESDHVKIVKVWEASVWSPHDFLSEEDIQFFKPLILSECLSAVVCYEYIGGKIINCSPVDGMGKPFPLLHMEM